MKTISTLILFTLVVSTCLALERRFCGKDLVEALKRICPPGQNFEDLNVSEEKLTSTCCRGINCSRRLLRLSCRQWWVLRRLRTQRQRSRRLKLFFFTGPSIYKLLLKSFLLQKSWSGFAWETRRENLSSSTSSTARFVFWARVDFSSRKKSENGKK